MNITIKPYHKNSHSLGAIVIKGSEVRVWLKEIQSMAINLDDVTCYALPGLKANSVYGCIVIFKQDKLPADIGRNSFFQKVNEQLFIPTNSIVYPVLSNQEFGEMFKDNLFVMHPVIGLVELENAIDWSSLLIPPKAIAQKFRTPKEGSYIPNRIRSFQIKQRSPEETLQEMEQTAFPKKEKLKDEPLSLFEKAKLKTLNWFFKKDSPSGKTGSGSGLGGGIGSTVLRTLLAPFFALGKAMGLNKAIEQLEMDLEELNRRNQNEVDKLIDRFKDNPEDALKFAIPLDTTGVDRGVSEEGQFSLGERWSNFSLFGNAGNTNGRSAVMADDSYFKLQRQYNDTAEALIKQGKFEKAAFVYMKLLKNHHLAAQTLENGELYAEAASVYLKFNNNKGKAAECYEKGNMINKAIELHKEIGNNEKVGDLYLTIQNKKEANHYFQKVVNKYSSSRQFVKAALVSKNKQNNLESAQELLMTGWEYNQDAFNCINNYFNNIEEETILISEIESIYKKLDIDKEKHFLTAIGHEQNKSDKVKKVATDLAYEIVAKRAKQNPSIVSELRIFNKKDKNLVKDIIKYKFKRKTQ